MDEGAIASQLSGRDVVRGAVEESLGARLHEQQWNLIWVALQKELARAFYLRGKQVLDVISTLLQGDTSPVHRDVLLSLWLMYWKVLLALSSQLQTERRCCVRSRMPSCPVTSTVPSSGLPVLQAASLQPVLLGLPSEVATVLTDTLKKIRFFVDTDVVISYLCAHEPSHAAAHAVVRSASDSATRSWLPTPSPRKRPGMR